MFPPKIWVASSKFAVYSHALYIGVAACACVRVLSSESESQAEAGRSALKSRAPQPAIYDALARTLIIQMPKNHNNDVHQ